MKWLAALLLCANVVPAFATQHHQLTERFGPVKSEWFRGEPVRLRYSVCNETDAPQTPCQVRCGVQVEIFDDSGTPVAETLPSGCGAVCSRHEWQPGECSTRIIEWPATDGAFGDGVVRGAPVGPGAYHAVMGGASNELVTTAFRLLDLPAPIPVWGTLGVLILAGSLALVVIARERAPT